MCSLHIAGFSIVPTDFGQSNLDRRTRTCLGYLQACCGSTVIPNAFVLDCSSVMEDDTDATRHVLTEGKNSKQDWIGRGQNFMDCRLFDLAAQCYRTANDPVRFTVATAYGTAMTVNANKAVMKPADTRQARYLVSLAIHHALSSTNTGQRCLCLSAYCMFAMTKHLCVAPVIAG